MIKPSTSSAAPTANPQIHSRSDGNRFSQVEETQFSRVQGLFGILREAQLPSPKPARPLLNASQSVRQAFSNPKAPNHLRRWSGSGPNTADLLEYQKNLTAEIRRLYNELDPLTGAQVQKRNKILLKIALMQTRLHTVKSALSQLNINSDNSESSVNSQHTAKMTHATTQKSLRAMGKIEDEKQLAHLDSLHADIKRLARITRSTSEQLPKLFNPMKI